MSESMVDFLQNKRLNFSPTIALLCQPSIEGDFLLESEGAIDFWERGRSTLGVRGDRFLSKKEEHWCNLCKARIASHPYD
jgi:hypothetical protein